MAKDDRVPFPPDGTAPMSASVHVLSALPSNVLALFPMVSVRAVASFVAVAAFPEQLLAVVAVAELPVHEAAVVAVAALPVHASAVVAAPPGVELPAKLPASCLPANAVRMSVCESPATLCAETINAARASARSFVK